MSYNLEWRGTFYQKYKSTYVANRYPLMLNWFVLYHGILPQLLLPTRRLSKSKLFDILLYLKCRDQWFLYVEDTFIVFDL